MAFNIGIGTTVIASQTEDGIPYLWASGDISTPPTFVGILTGFEPLPSIINPLRKIMSN